MGVINSLCSFALKPLADGVCEFSGLGAVGDATGLVADFLHSRFCDKSLELFEALHGANDRAWKSVEVALAGESFWGLFSDRTDKSLREQIRDFLKDVPLPKDVEQ